MVHLEFVALIAGESQRKQIFSPLQVHLLGKDYLLHLSRLTAVQIGFFYHGVGTGDLHADNIFHGIGENRRRNMLMESHPHVNGKGGSLHDGIGPYSPLVCQIHFQYLRLVGSIFQQFGILPRFRTLLRIVSLLILSHQHLFIGVYHLLGGTLPQKFALVQQVHPVAVLADAAEIMADKHNGLAFFLELLKLPVTFCLEKHVSHGQSLVHNQDLRVDIDGHRKSQPYKHTAGIGFHRLVHIVPNIRKLQYLRQLFLNLLLGKTDHGAVEIHILNTIVLHVKSRPQLQQSGYPSVYLHLAGSRAQHSGDDLKNRGLTGTVGADNAHRLPLMNRHIYVPQRIVLPVLLFGQPQSLPEAIRGLVVQFIYFT